MKKTKLKGCFLHKTDEWSTPHELYQKYMKDNYYDPCPKGTLTDGCVGEWKEKNFVNPPYSDIAKFVDKAIDELHFGNKTALLVPSRTDTKWFHKILKMCDVNIIFIQGRLHFNNSKQGAPFPSMIIEMNALKEKSVKDEKIIS